MQVGLMYMFTRIAINVPQVYLPLYLTSSLLLNKKSIAYYPLVMLICSVLGCFLTRPLTKFGGKRVTYVCGAVLVIGSAFWFMLQVCSWFLLFGGKNPALKSGIYYLRVTLARCPPPQTLTDKVHSF